MDIPYNNRHMENVRLIAQKCFKKLIFEFLKDLRDIIQGEIKEYGSYWYEIDDKIIKWEEKLE